ncbi:MAG: hypothetical protein ACXWUH_04310 [Burkholderiales bacterium]
MKVLMGLSVVAMLAAAAPAMADRGWSDPAIDQRQERLFNRIERGFRAGELSRQEYRRLRDELRRIEHDEHYYLSDGRLSPRERDHLHARLDHLARAVYVQRHDGDRRYGSYNAPVYPDRRF